MNRLRYHLSCWVVTSMTILTKFLLRKLVPQSQNEKV